MGSKVNFVSCQNRLSKQAKMSRFRHSWENFHFVCIYVLYRGFCGPLLIFLHPFFSTFWMSNGVSKMPLSAGIENDLLLKTSRNIFEYVFRAKLNWSVLPVVSSAVWRALRYYGRQIGFHYWGDWKCEENQRKVSKNIPNLPNNKHSLYWN